MANPIQGLKIDTNILDVKKQFDELINYINNKTKKPFEINFNLNGIQQQIEKINTQFNTLGKGLNLNVNGSEANGTMDSFSQKFKVAQGEAEALVQTTKQFTTETGQSVKVIEDIGKATGEVTTKTTILTDNYKKQGTILQDIANTQEKYNISMQNLSTKYGSLMNNGTLPQQVKEFQTTLNGLDEGNFNKGAIANQFKQIEANVKASSSALRLANQDAKGFGDTLLSDATKFALWMTIGTLIMQPLHAIEQGIADVKQLDDTINDLKMDMMSTSQTAFDGLVQSSRNLSIALGSNISDIDEMMKVYANANITVDEIMKKTKPAAILTNITDMSATESVDAIQAIMLQFDQFKKSSDDVATQATHVTDVLASVGQSLNVNFKTGVSAISEAVKASGAVINEAGMSYEKYASIVGKVTEIQRISGSTIGNAMKTIASRISRANSGDASDEDISAADKAYKSIGIDVRDATGNFKDLDITLNSLSNVWGGLNSVQKSYIAEQSAGVRQKSIFITMMDNYANSTKMATDAINSQGLAEAKNSIYLDSIGAKLNVLGNEITAMWQQGINSNIFKGVIDGATSLVSVFGNLHSILAVVGTAILLFKGASILEFFTKLPSKITTSVMGLSVYKTAMGAMELADEGLIAKNEVLSLSFSALGTSIKNAFLSNPLGWIAMGLTTVISAIDIFNSKQKEISQQAQEAQQKLEQETSTLNNLKSQYAQIISSGNLTTESKSQLKSIQDQLNETYGTELKNLDLINGKYEDQIKILNQVSAKKAQDLMNSMGSQATEAQDALNKQAYSSFGSASGKYYYNKEADEKTKQMINNTFDSATTQAGYIEGNTFEQLGNMEDRVNKLKTLITSLQQIPNPSKNLQGFIDDLSSELNKLNPELEKNQSTLKKYNDAKNTVDFYNQFKDQINQTDTLMQKLNKTSDTNEKAGITKQLEDLKKSMTDTASQSGKIKDFQGSIDDLFSSISTGSEQASNGMGDFSNSTSTATSRAEEFQKAVDSMSSEMKRLNQDIYDVSQGQSLSGEEVANLIMTYPQLSNAVKATSDGYTIEKSALEAVRQTQINSMNTTLQAQKANALNTLNSAKSQLQSYGVMISAIKSYATAQAEASKIKVLQGPTLSGATLDVGTPNANLKAEVLEYGQLLDKINALGKVLSSGSYGVSSSSGSSKSSASKSAEDAKKAAEDAAQAREDAYSAIDDINQKLIDSIKAQVDEEKKALDDRLDNYKQFIQNKLDALDAEYTQEDRKKKLADEAKKKADLEAQKNELLLDTSPEAKARKNALDEQIASQQQAIDDLNTEYSREDRKNNLNDQLDAYEKQIEDQKAQLDAKYSDAEVAKLAKNSLVTGLVAIGDKTMSVKQLLLDTLKKSGEAFESTGAKIQTELIDKLSQVQTLVKNLNSDGTISSSVALKVMGSHAGGAKITKQGIYELHPNEWVINSTQGNILDKIVKNDYSFLRNFKANIPTIPTVTSNNTGSIQIGSIIGNVQGSVDKTTLPILQKIIEDKLPQLVAEAQVNNDKKLGTYNPRIK